MESCTAALGILGILTQLPNLQHCLTWRPHPQLRQCLCILPSPSLATSGACLQVPPVASSTNRIFTGNNFANIMNLVNSFHALRSRSIAVRFGSQHVSTQPVFCSSWILCRADLHSFDQHTLGGKIIWARARRLSDNNNLT